MPDTCCAVGCANRREKNGIPFYRFPKNPERRERWITAVKRDNWTAFNVERARLCGEHFISGKQSKDKLSPDYVPSVFKHKNMTETTIKSKQERYERSMKRRKTAESTDNHDSQPEPEPEYEQTLEDIPEPEETEPADEKIKRLETENAMLREQLTKTTKEKKTAKQLNKKYYNELNKRNSELYELRKGKFGYKQMRKNLKQLRFFTGISPAIFNYVFELIENNVKKHARNLSKKDHLLIVLMKLRLGSMNADIAYRFNISPGRVTTIYRKWLPVLANALGEFIFWPERQAVRKYMPACFVRFPNCCSIIDCTEIFIRRPLGLNTRAQTWSNYKNTNTIKYLVSCTPAGAVNFVSNGWGGRVSDKEITIKSGYMDNLQPLDVVLADRGFQLDQEFAMKGAFLKVPAFTRGKSQMPKVEVDRSRKIANVRIHIERVIGRLRKFNILNTVIPINQVDLLDHVMVAIAGLVNLNKSVVSSKK